MKAKLGIIQQTIPEEKRKAFERDGRCVIPTCNEIRFSYLDFHHVYWHASERKYNDPERNLAKNGVMLCRKHHDEIPKDTSLDAYCRRYLQLIYEDSK